MAQVFGYLMLAGAVLGGLWLIVGSIVEAEKPAYIEVDDPIRKHVIRESAYQARADEESKILRIKGRRQIGPLKRVRAL